MAAAIEDGTQNLAEHSAAVTVLRNKLIDTILKIPGAHLTGDPENRLPGLASFVFSGIHESVHIINKLNEAGICASSGSACSASSKEEPHVLTATGYDEKIARSALRISLSAFNTEKEVAYILNKVPQIIEELRLSGQ
jgi:cysteine desulfurase